MNESRTAESIGASAQPLLFAHRLCAGYKSGEPVLEDLELCVSGPLVHLQGRNGSGKSTLVEVIAGVLEPFSGTFLLGGLHPASEAARRSRRVSRSEPALVPALTVRMHMELVNQGLGLSLDALQERLARYGLAPWLDTPAGELSLGNTKKVWLVLSTATISPIMVLDEPFNGLDAASVRIVVEEIEQWLNTGSKVIIVAHDMPAGLRPDQRLELPTRIDPQELPEVAKNDYL